MKTKTIISLALVCTLLLALTLPVGASAAPSSPSGDLSNFKPVNYFQGFSDVPENQWYFDYVKTAYQYGLMKGKSAALFDPTGTVTLAETLTMACRIHNIYSGGDGKFQQAPGANWYRVYVDYAMDNDIIIQGFDNYNRAATRAEFAYILSRSLPHGEFSLLNLLPEGGIPDVNDGTPYSDNIAVLYMSGVLNGKDDAGRFEPYANVLRGEAATVMCRVIMPQLRVITDKALDQSRTQLMLLQEACDRHIDHGSCIQAHYGSSATAYIVGGEVAAIREYPEYNPDIDGYGPDACTITFYFSDDSLYCAHIDYENQPYLINAYFLEGELLLLSINGLFYHPELCPISEELSGLPEQIAPNYEHVCSTWPMFAG